MKLKFVLFVIAVQLIAGQVLSQVYKPYVLGAQSTSRFSDVKLLLKDNLEAQGFNILGEYAPAKESSRWLIVVSSDELVEAVGSVGDLAGFAATLRIGLTEQNGKILISYTNPFYWGNAYFRENFSQVEKNYAQIDRKLKKAMDQSGMFIGTAFGSKKGIEAEDLHSYHYMIGMPRMQNTVELTKYGSFEEACMSIDNNLRMGVPGVEEVYSIDVPGKDLKLYGFALTGNTGEAKFLPIIDIGDPKHTAFLPYELLVKGNEVHMLHGRYRIALSFPDLTMMTFTKIMSTPGDIRDLLKNVTKEVSGSN